MKTALSNAQFRAILILAALILAAVLFAISTRAQSLDDTRAQMFVTRELNAGHTNHAPKFYVRDALMPNSLAEIAVRLKEVHPAMNVDVWTELEKPNSCRANVCRERKAPPAQASVLVQWEAVSSAYNLAGYLLLQGLTNGVFTVTNFVGLVTNAIVSLLDTNRVNYFALRARDVGGLESPVSAVRQYDPAGNEDILQIPVRKEFLAISNRLGSAKYYPGGLNFFATGQLGWWTEKRTITVPGTNELRGMFP